MFGCGIGNPYQSRLQSFRVGGCNAVSNRFTSAQKQNIKKKKEKKKKKRKEGRTYILEGVSLQPQPTRASRLRSSACWERISTRLPFDPPTTCYLFFLVPTRATRPKDNHTNCHTCVLGSLHRTKQ